MSEKLTQEQADMNGKITISFECADADIAADLAMFYELIQQTYGDYDPTFLIHRLPGVLAHLSDIIYEHLEGNVWYGDRGAAFEFTEEEMKSLDKFWGKNET